MAKKEDGSVRFLYDTALGRSILKAILRFHLDKPAVLFLRSRLSRPYMKSFALKKGLVKDARELKGYRTYRDLFLRERSDISVDMDPDHLISPCDGWLSSFKISPDSLFRIKGSDYRVSDILDDPSVAERYSGGDCLIFRLCPSDYHHYLYIDNCHTGKNHYIPGELHSVQPVACSHFRVYTLNRRSWCQMDTDNFGIVVQTEVGALIVGGIKNHHSKCQVMRGTEKGYFDLSGSTIVLLFERDRIRLREDILQSLSSMDEEYPEYRVEAGMWIGNRVYDKR